MDPFLMEAVRHILHVGEPLSVKGLLSPFSVLPGEPVQHQRVQPELPFPVALRHRKDLLLGLVPLLGLDISVGPLRQERGLPGQITVAADHLVQIFPRDKIIIHFRIRFRIEIRAVLGILKNSRASGREQKSVISVGNKERNGDLAVGLMQILHGAPQVQHTLLVLAQPVEAFLFLKSQMQPGMVQLLVKFLLYLPHHFFHAVCSNDLLRRHVPAFRDAVGIELLQLPGILFPLRQKELPVRVQIADCRVGTGNLQRQPVRRDPDPFFPFLKVPA